MAFLCRYIINISRCFSHFEKRLLNLYLDLFVYCKIFANMYGVPFTLVKNDRLICITKKLWVIFWHFINHALIFIKIKIYLCWCHSNAIMFTYTERSSMNIYFCSIFYEVFQFVLKLWNLKVQWRHNNLGFVALLHF